MNFVKKIGWIGGLCLLITGCGSAETVFEPNVFSQKDMCVAKVDDAKAQVCYGTSREEAEKVAGNASEDQDVDALSYAEGLQLFYREDRVAGIRLLEESEGRYMTSRGMKVGMSRQEIIKLYGDQYMDMPGSGFLEYFYDSENEKLLTDPKKDLPARNQEDSQEIRLVSAKLNGEERAEYLLITDRRWAVYMD